MNLIYLMIWKITYSHGLGMLRIVSLAWEIGRVRGGGGRRVVQKNKIIVIVTRLFNNSTPYSPVRHLSPPKCD